MKKKKLFLSFQKLLLLTALIPFLVTGPVFAQSNSFKIEERIEAKTIDKRAQILQAYLSKFDSPLQYQSQDFVDAADKYNLDWKLVAAISGVESTFGKFIPGGYNAWGWGVYGTQAIYFNSWREAIFTISEGLRQNYFDKGLDNPYEINTVYAASPSWGAHVTYFLKDMEKFQKEYETKQTLLPELEPQTAGISGRLASTYIY